MLPELQQYYEDRLSMMTTQAWSQLLEDLLEMRTQYENIRNCDAVTLEFRKGQLEILNKKTLVYCLKNNKIKLTDFHQ